MQYKIYAALKEDINSGLVWLINPSIEARPIICIKNIENNKVVLCEGLNIESNFKRIYNSGHTIKLNDSKNPLVINDWYRKKLSITGTQINAELEITIKKCILSKLRALLQHPQIVIRIATSISIISISLGIIGLALGLISFFNK